MLQSIQKSDEFHRSFSLRFALSTQNLHLFNELKGSELIASTIDGHLMVTCKLEKLYWF